MAAPLVQGPLAALAEAASPVAVAQVTSSAREEPALVVGPPGKTLVTEQETTPIAPGLVLTARPPPPQAPPGRGLRVPPQ